MIRRDKILQYYINSTTKQPNYPKPMVRWKSYHTDENGDGKNIKLCLSGLELVIVFKQF